MFGENRYAYSARYGACDPILAPWPRTLVYLVWRLFMALLRPSLFAGLLVLAGYFTLRALEDAPRLPLGAPPSAIERMETAFQNATPSGADPLGYWNDLVAGALNAPARGGYDLLLARSHARSLGAIMSRDALALYILSENRRPDRVEAELRAGPVWQREQMLEAALTEAMALGAAQGFEPPELIFTPPMTQARLRRAAGLFERLLEAADAWFVRSGGQALSVSALPGFQARNGESVTLYGDVRDIIVQGCALAREGRFRVEACEDAGLPRVDSDPVLAGLSLAAADIAAGYQIAGVRISKAARAAGLLDDDFAARLALGVDATLGREAFMAAVMPLLYEAGEVYAQPVRYVAMARAAATQYRSAARLDTRQNRRVYQALSTVRRHESALIAVRIAGVITSEEDARRLEVLADVSDGKLLSLHAQLGRDMLAIAGSPPRNAVYWPQSVKQHLALAAGLLLLGFLLVLIVVVSGMRRRVEGEPGWLERLDASASRLILGRNI